MADARSILDQLIREHGEDYASLSRLLGRNAAYIQQFIRRGTPRKLDEDDRRTLARYFRIDEAMLGGPTALPPARSGRAGHVNDPVPGWRGPQRPVTDLIRVPRYAVRASAGSGALDADEFDVGAIGLTATFLRTLCDDPSQLSMIQVTGDSMEPALGDGDDILVDRADAADRLRDGIYVLRFDDALNVKRIAMNPEVGRITVRSDNPAYPSWPDCDPARIAIIGRVVWVGRRVR
ncbi:MAG: S24 family peptidase [Sphingomonadales bacterium]